MEHDSHEFVLYILNKLKEELTEKNARLPTDPNNNVSKIWKSYSESFPS